MAPIRTAINRMILESEMNTNRNTSQSILDKVFYNENLLEQIFKFLPINDLLSTRLVCTTWKSESDRILKFRQTLIILKTEQDIQCITDIMDKQKVLGETKLFNKFLIAFDQIHLEQASVRNFLNSNGPFFEQLSLSFSLDSGDAQNTPESFKYLLEKQVPNLRSLQFFRFSKKLWLSGDLFSDSHNLLPKLKDIGCIKCLDLKCHDVDTYAHERENCPLYLSLFSRLPCVKKIAINYSIYWSILFRHAASSNSNALRKFFSKVEEIRTEFYDLKLLKAMGMRAPFTERINDPQILYLMPLVCPKVRILRLDFYPGLEANGNVGNLLTKYADQLEELWINEHLSRTSYCTTSGSRLLAKAVPLVNEFFTTTVFRKLRIIRTGVDIFRPAKAVTQLFDKQLPMLESLSLLKYVDQLAWNYDFQNVCLHTLELSRESMWKLDYLSPISQAFSNIKRLSVHLFKEDGLEAVVRAFPNLEELTIKYDSYDFRNLTTNKVVCIGNLKHLNYLSIEGFSTDNCITWLKQLKSITFLNITERT